ncbi:MAG: uroporphyrinogen-III synthase [Sulfurimonas sp.]|nr:uroporphyrinogen-III synthase [Sulfurimonadaceae bacterium]
MEKKIYLFATSKSDRVTSIKSLDVAFLTPKIDFSKYDHLIITSKQTIKALEAYKKSDFIDKPAICVSQKTASYWEKFGGRVLGYGNGYGNSLIHNIKEFSKDTKWLYLRARVIASSFVKMAKDEGYNIDEQILYESDCSDEILSVRAEAGDTLIFTSPSSVDCFLKNNTIDSTSRVIVIGTTTAKSLPDGIEYEMSKKTTIESLLELL